MNGYPTREQAERWSIIPGYNGIYKVSSFGNVVNTITGNRKACSLRKDGYIVVCLSIHKRQDTRFVHRLVAEAFLEMEQGKPYVNHIDENKQNNMVENLEWCTASHNSTHNDLHNRIAEKNMIPVLQLLPDGSVLRRWRCGKEASRALSIDQTLIIRCCKHRNKSAKGTYWKYEREA